MGITIGQSYPDTNFVEDEAAAAADYEVPENDPDFEPLPGSAEATGPGEGEQVVVVDGAPQIVNDDDVEEVVAEAHADDAEVTNPPEVEVNEGEYLYDPNEDDVAGVNKYLATASEEERERVLAAEKDGKARKGILEA